MDIDSMTIGQARQIAAMFGENSEGGTFTPHIGKKCIVRTYASGVHFGTVTAQSGRQVEIKGARRLWRWHCEQGISLSDLSIYGIDGSKSRVCQAVESMTITDALEIIPCTSLCVSTIEATPMAQK